MFVVTMTDQFAFLGDKRKASIAAHEAWLFSYCCLLVLDLVEQSYKKPLDSSIFLFWKKIPRKQKRKMEI